MSIVERDIRCPYCAEPISILLDPSAGAQAYIEDCQVCCQPMQIVFDATDGEILELRIDRGG